MSDQQQSDLVRVGGLWLNTDKHGQSYMSGSLGMARLLIFKNAHKSDGSNDPDYVLYVAPSKKREQSESEVDFNDTEEIPF